MTDRERADRLWESLVDLIDTSGDARICAEILAEFAAVREDERRAIVTWLDANGFVYAASRIERGEHTS